MLSDGPGPGPSLHCLPFLPPCGGSWVSGDSQVAQYLSKLLLAESPSGVWTLAVAVPSAIRRQPAGRLRVLWLSPPCPQSWAVSMCLWLRRWLGFCSPLHHVQSKLHSCIHSFIHSIDTNRWPSMCQRLCQSLVIQIWNR